MAGKHWKKKWCRYRREKEKQQEQLQQSQELQKVNPGSAFRHHSNFSAADSGGGRSNESHTNLGVHKEAAGKPWKRKWRRFRREKQQEQLQQPQELQKAAAAGFASVGATQHNKADAHRALAEILSGVQNKLDMAIAASKRCANEIITALEDALTGVVQAVGLVKAAEEDLQASSLLQQEPSSPMSIVDVVSSLLEHLLPEVAHVRGTLRAVRQDLEDKIAEHVYAFASALRDVSTGVEVAKDTLGTTLSQEAANTTHATTYVELAWPWGAVFGGLKPSSSLNAMAAVADANLSVIVVADRLQNFNNTMASTLELEFWQRANSTFRTLSASCLSQLQRHVDQLPTATFDKLRLVCAQHLDTLQEAHGKAAGRTFEIYTEVSQAEEQLLGMFAEVAELEKEAVTAEAAERSPAQPSRPPWPAARVTALLIFAQFWAAFL